MATAEGGHTASCRSPPRTLCRASREEPHTFSGRNGGGRRVCGAAGPGPGPALAHALLAWRLHVWTRKCVLSCLAGALVMWNEARMCWQVWKHHSQEPETLEQRQLAGRRGEESGWEPHWPEASLPGHPRPQGGQDMQVGSGRGTGAGKLMNG